MKFHVIYGLCLLLYCIGWGGIYKKQQANKSKGIFRGIFLLAGLFIPIFVTIYLTHDIAVVSYLKDQHCNDSMEEIKETVNYPGSVYWEDNVLGGFIADNRRWMVEHYLDGIHLKILALNGKDGRVYVYNATDESFNKSKWLGNKIQELEREYQEASKPLLSKTEEEKEIFLHKMQPNFQRRKVLREKILEQRIKEILTVLQNVRVFNNINEAPQINYTVKKSPTLRPSWQNRYLYTDQMEIVDNSSGKIVASANRVLRYKYKTEFDFVHSPSSVVGFTVCGLGKLHSLGEDVLFPQANQLRSLIDENTKDFKISKFDYIVGN